MLDDKLAEALELGPALTEGRLQGKGDRSADQLNKCLSAKVQVTGDPLHLDLPQMLGWLGGPETEKSCLTKFNKRR